MLRTWKSLLLGLGLSVAGLGSSVSAQEFSIGISTGRGPWQGTRVAASWGIPAYGYGYGYGYAVPSVVPVAVPEPYIYPRLVAVPRSSLVVVDPGLAVSPYRLAPPPVLPPSERMRHQLVRDLHGPGRFGWGDYSGQARPVRPAGCDRDDVGDWIAPRSRRGDVIYARPGDTIIELP